jgi:hypothetical protein
MNLRRLGRLSSTICVLLLLVAATLAPKAHAEEASVNITSDTDCILVVDGKVTARLQRGAETTIQLETGSRKVSAYTAGGDVWESEVNVTSPSNPPLSIPLRAVEVKRVAAQENVAALKSTVDQLQAHLTAIEEQNHNAMRNAEAVRHDRVLIVQAVSYYAQRWGTELGLQGERHATSERLTQDAAINLMSQNQYTQMGALAELGIAWYQAHKAHRNEKVAGAATVRMRDLEAALKDPLGHPPSPGEDSYLVMVRKTYDGKRAGELITAPDSVIYRGERKSFQVSCSGVRGVSGSKKLEIHYAVHDSNNPKKKHKGTVHLKAQNKSESKLLLTDVYLACPKLTQ